MFAGAGAHSSTPVSIQNSCMCYSDAYTHVCQRTRIHVCVHKYRCACKHPQAEALDPCRAHTPSPRAAQAPAHAAMLGCVLTAKQPHLPQRACEHPLAPHTCTHAPQACTQEAPERMHAAGVCRQAHAHCARAPTRRQQAQNPHVHGTRIPRPRVCACRNHTHAWTHTRQRAGHGWAGGAGAWGGGEGEISPQLSPAAPHPAQPWHPRVGGGLCGGRGAASKCWGGDRDGVGMAALCPPAARRQRCGRSSPSPHPVGCPPPPRSRAPAPASLSPAALGRGRPAAACPPLLSHSPTTTTTALSDSPCCWGGAINGCPQRHRARLPAPVPTHQPPHRHRCCVSLNFSF